MPKRKLAGRKLLAVAASAALIGSSITAAWQAPAAYATNLPNWDDVQNAKANEAATAAKVAEIEKLLAAAQAELKGLEDKAAQAAQKAEVAQAAFESADRRQELLEIESAKSAQAAKAAAESAAGLVSQMYRSGGIDHNLQLFLDGDANTADTLLDRLAMMAKATERNTVISESAKQTTNTAKALGEQAQSAATERQKLYKEAESSWQEAAAEVEKSRQRQQEVENNQRVLEAQLAALKDTTAATVAGYQERLRLEEQERQRQIAEAKRKAAEDARRAQQQASHNSGGGSAPPPPPATGSAPTVSGQWVSPLARGTYTITCHYGCYPGHVGIDLGAAPWTPIYAASAGKVTFSGWNRWGGNMVTIAHADGVSTSYLHMVQSPSVAYGQWVGAGQIIGYVGTTGNSTGNHLHYETRVSGRALNPYVFMQNLGLPF